MKSLFIRQFVDETLGNSSYLIASEDTGLAAIIDPQRDIEPYLRAADGLGLKVVYGLETHLHADFVSGVHELNARLEQQKSRERFRVGASAKALVEFPHVSLQEGDRLSLGNLSIGVMETPGHSPEHISFSICAENSTIPEVLFSGGSLIVGGTGRPDLLGHEQTHGLAAALYHTLHHKLAQLPDEVIVYPTHGAGSFCNTIARADRCTTIGEERRSNPFFEAQEEEEFVERALGGLSSYPTYYRYLRSVNKKGAQVLGEIPALAPLSPAAVKKLKDSGTVILDIRATPDFLGGHIEGSYGIPLITPLSTWAGWVIPFGSPVILVTDSLIEQREAVRQLVSIGYDHLLGYLEGGVTAWEEAGLPVVSAENISAAQLQDMVSQNDAPPVLDVRYEREWRAGHIRGALHIEAGALPEIASNLFPKGRPLVVYCQGGNRSTVAISLLEQQGYRNLYALESGFNAWRRAGYEIVTNG